MLLAEVNWRPSDRQLRQFAVVCLIVLPLLGWIWDGAAAVVLGLAATGFLVLVVGIVYPKGVKPIYLTLTVVTVPIGMVVGELALLCIYFGVFLPMGIVFRFVRRDALQTKIQRDAESYWEEMPPGGESTSYFRQF